MSADIKHTRSGAWRLELDPDKHSDLIQNMNRLYATDRTILISIGSDISIKLHVLGTMRDPDNNKMIFEFKAKE